MANAKMCVAEQEKFLHAEFPRAFSDGNIRIETPTEPAVFCGGASARKRRVRGTVSGRTLMALAELAMDAVLLSAIGPVAPVLTTSLNNQFSKKHTSGKDVLVRARLLKLGRRLAAGEVNLRSGALPSRSPMSPRPIPFQTFADFQGIIAP